MSCFYTRVGNTFSIMIDLILHFSIWVRLPRKPPFLSQWSLIGSHVIVMISLLFCKLFKWIVYYSLLLCTLEWLLTLGFSLYTVELILVVIAMRLWSYGIVLMLDSISLLIFHIFLLFNYLILRAILILHFHELLNLFFIQILAECSFPLCHFYL